MGRRRPTSLPQRSAFGATRATSLHFFGDAVGTMMWAYCVPAHITHGPTLWRVVGKPWSAFGSGTSSITCGGSYPHSLSGVSFSAKGSRSEEHTSELQSHSFI